MASVSGAQSCSAAMNVSGTVGLSSVSATRPSASSSTVNISFKAYVKMGSSWTYNSIAIYFGGKEYTVFNSSSGSKHTASNGTYSTSAISTSVSTNGTTASITVGVNGTVWNPSSAKKNYTFTISGIPSPTYAVKYDANGGSGAPGNQTKTYGTALTLSSTKPTRANYDFVKWNTKADGSGTSYNPGASYTGNAALTLYAIWVLAGHNITFNANGGTGAPATIFKNADATITIPTTVPVRSGYDFLGWATSAGGTAVYQPGDSYSTNAALNLYAVWDISDPSGLQLLLKNNSRLVIYCEINPPIYGAGVSLDYYVYTTNRGKITYHGNNLLTVVLEEGSANQDDVIITLYAVDTAGQQSNTDVLTITPRNYWKSFYGQQELNDKVFYGNTPAVLAARKERIFYTNVDYQQTTYAEMSQKTYQQLRIKGLN